MKNIKKKNSIGRDALTVSLTGDIYC